MLNQSLVTSTSVSSSFVDKKSLAQTTVAQKPNGKFRIIKKPRKHDPSGKVYDWYHVEKKFLFFWIEYDYFLSLSDAISYAERKMYPKEKDKLPSPMKVWESNV